MVDPLAPKLVKAYQDSRGNLHPTEAAALARNNAYLLEQKRGSVLSFFQKWGYSSNSNNLSLHMMNDWPAFRDAMEGYYETYGRAKLL